MPFVYGAAVCCILQLRAVVNLSTLQLPTRRPSNVLLHVHLTTHSYGKWLSYQTTSGMGVFVSSYYATVKDYSMWMIAWVILTFNVFILSTYAYLRYVTPPPLRQEYVCTHLTNHVLVENNKAPHDCRECLCSVCFEEKHHHPVIYSQTCRHSLHVDCVLKLCNFSEELKCPECRQPFFTSSV